jgi:hypothetical protein
MQKVLSNNFYEIKTLFMHWNRGKKARRRMNEVADFIGLGDMPSNFISSKIQKDVKITHHGDCYASNSNN